MTGIDEPLSGTPVRGVTVGTPTVGLIVSMTTTSASASLSGPVLPAMSSAASASSASVTLPLPHPVTVTVADVSPALNPWSTHPAAVPPRTRSSCARPVTLSVKVIV